jgi:flagellar basal body-associated protein FliL
MEPVTIIVITVIITVGVVIITRNFYKKWRNNKAKQAWEWDRFNSPWQFR